MKTIRTIADIKRLKETGIIPPVYLQSIENQFYDWFAAEGADESISTFCLGKESCIYHLENEEDTDFIGNQLFLLEYVEYESVEGVHYFRIGMMQEQEMNILFFLEGTIDPAIEEWLKQ